MENKLILSNEIKKVKSIPQCAICLNIISYKKLKKLSCNHKFHWRCIDRWIKINSSCPVCRELTCEKCKEHMFREEDYLLDEILITLFEGGNLSSPN